MDRRWFMTSIAGVAAGSAWLARDEDGEAQGRPPLAVEPDGPGRWRVRSWEWRNGAWRPAIAHATSTAAGIQLRGRIGAADRAEVAALLGGGGQV